MRTTSLPARLGIETANAIATACLALVFKTYFTTFKLYFTLIVLPRVWPPN
jgi:hypothetical protein